MVQNLIVHKRGEPTVFGLNQVIRGWTEGLQLMKIGAKYKFFIHPRMAYGSRDKPGIPANSALIFEVDLLILLIQTLQLKSKIIFKVR